MTGIRISRIYVIYVYTGHIYFVTEEHTDTINLLSSYATSKCVGKS